MGPTNLIKGGRLKKDAQNQINVKFSNIIENIDLLHLQKNSPRNNRKPENVGNNTKMYKKSVNHINPNTKPKGNGNS
jgi:hypothetical protein